MSGIPLREFPAPVDPTQGARECLTAGDEGLHPAGKRDCMHGFSMTDLVFGAYDSATCCVCLSVLAGDERAGAAPDGDRLRQA